MTPLFCVNIFSLAGLPRIPSPRVIQPFFLIMIHDVNLNRPFVSVLIAWNECTVAPTASCGNDGSGWDCPRVMVQKKRFLGQNPLSCCPTKTYQINYLSRTTTKEERSCSLDIIIICSTTITTHDRTKMHDYEPSIYKLSNLILFFSK